MYNVLKFNKGFDMKFEVDNVNDYKAYPYHVFISKTDKVEDFNWMCINYTDTSNHAVYLALTKLGEGRGWLIEDYNDDVNYESHLKLLLLKDNDKLGGIYIYVYDHTPNWYAELLEYIRKYG